MFSPDERLKEHTSGAKRPRLVDDVGSNGRQCDARRSVRDERSDATFEVPMRGGRCESERSDATFEVPMRGGRCESERSDATFEVPMRGGRCESERSDATFEVPMRGGRCWGARERRLRSGAS
jgi:hypothetical protein